MMMFRFAHRNHASMRHFADLMFELDGRVIYAKIVMQTFFEIAQNLLTGRWWYIRD